jgi:hypothetical protein
MVYPDFPSFQLYSPRTLPNGKAIGVAAKVGRAGRERNCLRLYHAEDASLQETALQEEGFE